MNIDSIQSGVVIDHITAGKGRVIYELLHLDDLDCSVAMIMNASSHKMGKKDIIKIDSNIPVDVDVIGYVDPEATINIIQNGTLVEKRALQLPELLTNVIRCKNPRCITSVEQELTQVFKLTDRNKKIYRCIYCEAKAGK
ncbi:MAG: aspartate carbamoyltransferase regulatory subunit [Oscillospiraceae bacterium]|nr:aspartate carbamoyltransferase regulatory subunit [Oscillospiraceae bacterium]